MVTLLEFLKFIYPYTKEHKWSFSITLIFVLLGCYTAIEVPLFIGEIIDNLNNIHVETDIYKAFLLLFALAVLDYIAQLGVRIAGIRYTS